MCFLLFRHPRGVLERQLSAANLLFTQVNVLPELGDCIKRSVMLERQAADLQRQKQDELIKSENFIVIAQEQ